MFDLTRSIHTRNAALGTGATKAAAQWINKANPQGPARDEAFRKLRELAGRTMASHEAAKEN
ncbi:MAG: hypothetical protein EP341_03235 [Sphingomonadales bacterium]|nr:MAG: hypothetical protein EP341_03235 [Sphingomonadales bacterium]